MTHGGLQKLGNGIGLTYTRPSVAATRPSVAATRPPVRGRPAEEPISVNVSVRSTRVENVYTGEPQLGCGPGQHLDCYI